MGIRRMLRARAAGAAILAAGLLTVGMGTIPASAGYVSCQTDPIVQLSNGTTIQLTATVFDAASDIQSVNYVLHVPAGVTVTDVSYGGDPLASLENLQVVPDNQNNNYNAFTTVTTGASTVGVVATMVGFDPNNGSAPTSVRAGLAGWKINTAFTLL